MPPVNPIEVKQLVDDLDSASMREFWWDSPLLARAAEARSPGVVRALLTRHHCLQNKSADSCHVIRRAIWTNDGPELPTLWATLGAVVESDSLIHEVDDPYSMPWASAYVLGEIGGRSALSKVTGKLRSKELGWQYLYIRMALHLLVRYAQAGHPDEPEIERVDVRTGKAFRSPMRESAPDIYERTMLRCRQENEAFVPVDPEMVPYLTAHITSIEQRVLPCDIQQVLTLVKMLPTE